MAELMFGLGQTKKKKATENTIRGDKAKQWNYKGRIDQDGTFLERKSKDDKNRAYKESQRDTKSKLKDVTQGEDGEMAIRKQQHSREKKWKETGRNQIKKNTNFDMARSLFGGGGPAPEGDYEDEEVDQVANEVENLNVGQSDDEYEEEVVTDEEEIEQEQGEKEDDGDDDSVELSEDEDSE